MRVDLAVGFGANATSEATCASMIALKRDHARTWTRWKKEARSGWWRSAIELRCSALTRTRRRQPIASQLDMRMPSSDSITRKIALPKMWSKASVSPKNSAMKSCSVDAVSISSVATERKISS